MRPALLLLLLGAGVATVAGGVKNGRITRIRFSEQDAGRYYMVQVMGKSRSPAEQSETLPCSVLEFKWDAARPDEVCNKVERLGKIVLENCFTYDDAADKWIMNNDERLTYTLLDATGEYMTLITNEIICVLSREPRLDAPAIGRLPGLKRATAGGAYRYSPRIELDTCENKATRKGGRKTTPRGYVS